MNHVSRCIAHDVHVNEYGDVVDNDQDDNAERGEFEIGYWCLKDSDCATKHCAQIGPRRYDKECQDTDFIDFVPDLKPRKWGPHKREPLPEDKSKDDDKKSDKKDKEPEKAEEEEAKNTFDLRQMAFMFQ